MLVAVSGLVWAMVRDPAGMRGEPESPAEAVVEEEAAAGDVEGS
jgi:hypothetical protein